jgi:hypothetical protein
MTKKWIRSGSRRGLGGVELVERSATRWTFSASERPMSQQSSREFASADPTKGEEDARIQERGIRAKISLTACSSLQQRLTSSHFGKNTPSLAGIGAANVV